jgi:GT2 family glycosyltransferase
MDLSIIIINWNTADLLKQCLQSVVNNLNNFEAEIWVIDNASSDHSVAMVKSTFPGVNLIENKENFGFAKANNLGSEHVRGRYILFLNPDTIIPAGTLSNLLSFAEAHPDYGLIGPKILNPDGSLQRSCWPGFPGIGMAISDAFFLWKIKIFPKFLSYEYSIKDLGSTRRVAHLLGACILIRRTAWEKVGTFDEMYYMYYEETDLCFRLSKHGWKVVYYPETEIIHYGQMSSRQIPEKSLQNYYHSLYHFCKIDRGYGYIRLALLKAVMYMAILMRLFLWHWRRKRAKGHENRLHGQKMWEGYLKTLKTIWAIT